jgi:multidrug efflux pump subunit AcrA (membrane-fusion protein)
MNDLELAQHRYAVCEFNELEALRIARRAEGEWLASAAAGQSISVAQSRYWRSEAQLSATRTQLEQARAALSALLPSEVA